MNMVMAQFAILVFFMLVQVVVLVVVLVKRIKIFSEPTTLQAVNSFGVEVACNGSDPC